MISRRILLGAAAAALGMAPLVALTQPADRVHRQGILHPGTLPPASDPHMVTAYTAPLRDLGYVEGRNLRVERRYADGRRDRLSDLARELLALKVDVVLAVGPVAARVAKEVTTTTPIVFLLNTDPVAAGLVQSLARPGGNVTGVLISPEGSLAGKRLELLRDSVPRATRIALLAPDEQGVAWPQLQETRAAAVSMGLDLVVVEARGGDYVRAFAAIGALHAQALVVAANAGFLRDRKTIIALAAKYRLPATYEWPRQVKDGGLMSYGADDIETYKQVTSYIDRLFKGAKPMDMPIWQPSLLYLVLNLRTAKALGLAIPQSLLLRADEVIE